MNATNTNVQQHTFTWQRLSCLKDHFALCTSGHQLAVLKIGGLLGPIAQLESGEHRFVFLASGIANRQIYVRNENLNATVAMYERSWQGAGGYLRLAEGGRLRWVRSRGFRNSDHIFIDAEGRAVASFAPNGRVMTFVTEDSPAEASPSLDLLTVLAPGWLLMTLAKDRTG
jgi:hypothetical protein